MASTALLVSTTVMGVLVVALALSTTRFDQRGYRPRLAERLERSQRPESGLVSSNELALLLAALLLAVIAAGIAFGDAGLILIAVPPAAVAAYFGWGVYHMARARGLPTAHSVALSAWVLGVAFIGLIAVNLVVG